MRNSIHRTKSLFGAIVPLLIGLAPGQVRAQSAARIVFEAPVTVQTSKRATTSYTQVFSMNPDGSGVVQLTSTSTNSFRPKWSPGQAYIAFCRAGQLWIMQAAGESNGGQSFAAALSGGGAADWSPDGSTLVFQGTDGGLYLLPVTPSAATVGTPVRLHAGSWFNPNWSPDGTKIAANGRADGNSDIIAIFDAATGAELATYVGSSNPTLYPCFAPQFSPDGTLVAFSGPAFVTTRKGTTSYQEIFLATPDLSSVTQATHLNGFSNFPTWSPDGNTLAFNSGNNSMYTTLLGSGIAILIHSPGNQLDWNP